MIHEIVESFSRHIEALENIGADIVNIDGNFEIVLSAANEYIVQSFTLRAKGKKLRRLKYKAC